MILQKYNEEFILLGRILLVLLFILSGVGKIFNYAGTQAFMSSMGIPGIFLAPTIALETLGALLIVIGYKTRILAFVLAGFTIATAVVFHMDFSNQMQMIMFNKNIAIAGGLFILTAVGGGKYSLDTYFNKK